MKAVCWLSDGGGKLLWVDQFQITSQTKGELNGGGRI
jgi:hypothetical protein